MSIRLEWKPQDCWIGAYWERRGARMHLWVCLLPMLPIHVSWPTDRCERCRRHQAEYRIAGDQKEPVRFVCEECLDERNDLVV